jgi:acetyl esterase/lipase
LGYCVGVADRALVARAFVDALRRVSTEPVAYAELPGAQHAFDMMYNKRTAHTVDAVERFLDLVRGAATAQARRPT